jgi:hypothetical protein
MAFMMTEYEKERAAEEKREIAEERKQAGVRLAKACFSCANHHAEKCRKVRSGTFVIHTCDYWEPSEKYKDEV